MWKVYNRFYKEILRKEVATCFLASNIYTLTKIRKVTLFFLSPEGLKRSITLLSCFKFFLNHKRYSWILADTDTSSLAMKVRRKQPTGSSFYFTKDMAVQFLHFAVHFLFPQLDSAFNFFPKMFGSVFQFFFKLTPACTTMLPFFSYFQGLPRVNFVIYCKEKGRFKGGYFLLRFLKFPAIFPGFLLRISV